MERIVGPGGEPPVDLDEVLHAGDLGREDDPVVGEAGGLGELGRAERALDHRLQRDVAGVARLRGPGVCVHQCGQQVLIERAPVHPDAHRLPIRHRNRDDGAEVLVTPLAAHVARVDPVLGQRAGAIGIPGEQEVAVVVEVADDRHRHPAPVERFDDPGHRRRGLLVIHRDPDQLAPGLGQRGGLRRRGLDIGGVGVGHRLDDDGMPAADGDGSDEYGGGGATQDRGHGGNLNRRKDGKTERRKVVGVCRLITFRLSVFPSYTSPSDLVSLSQATASSVPSFWRGVSAAKISARFPSMWRSRSSPIIRAKRCSYSSASNWPLFRPSASFRSSAATRPGETGFNC